MSSLLFFYCLWETKKVSHTFFQMKRKKEKNTKEKKEGKKTKKISPSYINVFHRFSLFLIFRLVYNNFSPTHFYYEKDYFLSLSDL